MRGKDCGQQVHRADSRAAPFIEKWDFTRVRAIKVDDIFEDAAAAPVLKKWFDIDPGPAPPGVVPDEIEARELPYVQQLVDAYGERAGTTLDHPGVRSHEVYGPHPFTPAGAVLRGRLLH